MSKTWRTLAGCVAFALLLPSCAGTKGMNPTSLLSMLGSKPQLSTLMGLVQSAGLEDLLSGKNPLTLLAPSNDAFKALGTDMLDNLMKPENKSMLTDILKGHIVPGALDANALASNASVQNMLGKSVDVTKTADGVLSVGGAKVQESLEGSNGYVHIIDQVLGGH